MNSPRHFFVAGIDFGTSYTKIYLEDQFTSLRKPVLFGDEKSGLLPSYIRLNDSMVAGPLDGNEGITIPYLKLLLADEVSNQRKFESLYQVDGTSLPPARVLVTGYFLALLESIRQFLSLDEDWKEYKPDRDPMLLQIAVPTGLQLGGFDIETLMLDCLKATLRLAREGVTGPTRIGAIEQCLDSLAASPDAEKLFLDKSCHHYPEVASAVQTMLRAGDLPEGKYITMDVGAGTVDMNFFFRNGSAFDRDSSSVDAWVTKVVPLGCACLGHLHSGAGEHERPGTGMSDEEMRSRLAIEIGNLMQCVFKLQPRKVMGDGPDVFHHGVRAYIFGGGANVSLYEETFKKTLDDLDVKVNQIMRLPRPDLNFVTPKGIDDFGRLAVAYGISTTPENLARTRLPDEMGTILREALEASRRSRSDGEMACSCFSNQDCFRCSGTGFVRRKDVAVNLDAIALWNSMRNVQFSKETKKEFFAALPEVKMLSRYIGQLTTVIKSGWIVCAYVIIKRMEYLQEVFPPAHCEHVLKDSISIIDKVFQAGREEIVEIDFNSLVEIENGFEADLTFIGPKGTRPNKRFSCICEKLPSKNQGGLITKCSASIINHHGFAALFVRVSEEDEPMPPNHELQELENKLNAILGI